MLAMAMPVVCWGCGSTQRETLFQICPDWIEVGYAPCAFCSPDCLRAAAPRYREYHREKARLQRLAEQISSRHWSSAAAATPVEEASPYDCLLDSLASSMSIGAPAAAAARPPPEAPAHVPTDAMQAAMEYVLAVERTMGAATSLQWAERVINAYALLSNTTELAAMPRPAWWNDDALKAMSSTVLQARPDYVLAWRLRGEVLCARLGGANWEASPRTAEELVEAGRCLQRAASFGYDELAAADKLTVVTQAVACMREAQAAQG